MVRVLVAHHRWGYGGGETVFYYTVKALADAGYDVTVSTVDAPDFKSYEDIVGESFPSNVMLVRAIPFDIKIFTIYKGLLSWIEAYRGSYDIIVVTHGYPLKLTGLKAPVVYYMHFPAILTVDTKWNYEFSRYMLKSPSRYGFREFLESIPFWLYIKPYTFISSRLYRYLLEVPWRILVNSTYTLKALKYTLGMYRCCYDVISKTEIVYPPLPRLEELTSLRGGAREPCVVTIGRFSSEKRYELVLETARILRDIEFYIAGGVYGRASRSYYNKIKRHAPSNVIVKANIPHDEKLSLLSNCTVYLHTMIGEHFGIAPLEALATGATPVVHTLSGTWTDICLENNYCYGYKKTNPEEIARIVEEAINKPKQAPIEHIEKYSPEKFMRTILRIVEEALLDKH